LSRVVAHWFVRQSRRRMSLSSGAGEILADLDVRQFRRHRGWVGCRLPLIELPACA
jgi:hypothetical protein